MATVSLGVLHNCVAGSFAEARCSMPSDFDSDYAYALGAVLGGRREDTVIESSFGDLFFWILLIYGEIV